VINSRAAQNIENVRKRWTTVSLSRRTVYCF